MENLLRALFYSWTGSGPLDRNLFSSNFVYDCGSSVYTTDVWLDVSRNDLPLTDVKLLELAGDADQGRLVFEFVDPVTLLRHKVTWGVECKDGLIVKVSELDPERRVGSSKDGALIC